MQYPWCKSIIDEYFSVLTAARAVYQYRARWHVSLCHRLTIVLVFTVKAAASRSGGINNNISYGQLSAKLSVIISRHLVILSSCHHQDNIRTYRSASQTNIVQCAPLHLMWTSSRVFCILWWFGYFEFGFSICCLKCNALWNLRRQFFFTTLAHIGSQTGKISNASMNILLDSCIPEPQPATLKTIETLRLILSSKS